MRVNVSVEPPDPRQMGQAILTLLAARFNSVLPAAALTIRAGLPRLVEDALNASSEWSSLVGGRLQAELGVPQPDRVLRSMILAIVEASEVRVLPVSVLGDGLAGGLSVSILRVDLAEVLGGGVPDSTIRTKGGFVVPWLDWLLTAGDEILILDYEFVGGNFLGSRTGLGIMRRGGSWRVPPEFAGVIGSNWLTRALERVMPEVERLVITSVQQAL